MKHISLIIGSGFSVPDGMKTVGQINATLAGLEDKDICIHSDMTLTLLNGQEKPDFSVHFFLIAANYSISEPGSDIRFICFMIIILIVSIWL